MTVRDIAEAWDSAQAKTLVGQRMPLFRELTPQFQEWVIRLADQLALDGKVAHA